MGDFIIAILVTLVTVMTPVMLFIIVIQLYNFTSQGVSSAVVARSLDMISNIL